VAKTALGDVDLLSVSGVLNSISYLNLRDQVIKTALDEPRAVLVDVDALEVPVPSAWAVFTSARWHVNRWPEVPIMLVCRHVHGRNEAARNGVSRYVPIHDTTASALAALDEDGGTQYRHRSRTELPADASSVQIARDLVAEWLTHWSQTDLIPTAQVIATVLIENVLTHTDSSPNLRLEANGATVTVAVEDASSTPANVREDYADGWGVSGLQILSALCRVWGNAPTSSGKTIWTVIGPENRL
jgi:hypothetical protein